MSFLSRVFRGKDSTATKKQAKPTAALNTGPAKPKWTDAWQRTEVAPEEVQDLVRGCVHELKARGKWWISNSTVRYGHGMVRRIADHSSLQLFTRHSSSYRSVLAPTPAQLARSFAITLISLSKRDRP